MCPGLHSNEAFALEGLGLAGVVAEQVAALAPVAGQEVQLAPASQEGCCIHIQVVVVLQQHKILSQQGHWKCVQHLQKL